MENLPARTFLKALCLGACLVAGMPAIAQPDEGPAGATQNIRDMSVDDLFERLRVSPRGRPAEVLERALLDRLHKSGSDTVDLLFGWALQAMQRDDTGLAIDVLDQVVILAPGFAEGWNKRATVAFMRKDYGASLADIRQTLRIEPRHFGALAGLGMILEQLERDDAALDAYRAALAVHPNMESVREAAEKLESRRKAREI